MSAEPPAAASAADRWPVWVGPVGFGIAVVATVVMATLVAGVAAAAGNDAPGDSPTVALIATLFQDLALMGAAVLIASRYGQVRLADFGLRSAPLRAAVKWTAVAFVSFYALSGIYAAAVQPEGEQDIVDTFGAERGTGYLVATAVMVILIAPVAEEFFFRGFFYRSVRNRLPPLGAALVVGAVFGSIHYTDADTLLLIPVLVVLGVVFCLLYERTGSLYPAIALHAVNNALALAVSADVEGSIALSSVLAVVAVAGCGAAMRRSQA